MPFAEKEQKKSPSALIINLSLLVNTDTNRSIQRFNALADLLPEGTEPSCTQSLRNTLWIIYQYATNARQEALRMIPGAKMLLGPCAGQGIIDKYKCGKISTDDFLEQIGETFSHLDKVSKGKLTTLWTKWKKKDGTAEAERHEPPTEKSALIKDLFTLAWNAVSEVDDNSIKCLQALIEQHPNKPIIFISNSNQLNIEKIVSQLRQKIKTSDNLSEKIIINPDMDTSYVTEGVRQYNNKATEVNGLEQLPGIADFAVHNVEHIFFYASYKAGMFKADKTSPLNTFFSYGTPGLVGALATVAKEDERLKNATILSQFGGDITCAKKYFPDAHCEKVTDLSEYLNLQAMPALVYQ